MTGLRGKPGFHGICPLCGKRSFLTKKLAKRQAHEIDPTMRVYRCEDNPEVWHMGHLPRAVIQGTIDRRTFYSSPEEEDHDV